MTIPTSEGLHEGEMRRFRKILSTVPDTWSVSTRIALIIVAVDDDKKE